MPELPEVTTVVRDLNRTVRGKFIADVWTDTPKLIAPLSVAQFRRRVRGTVFRGFARRGKFILACLGRPRRRGSRHVRFPVSGVRSLVSGFWFLVWHLRMTGHPLYRNPQREAQHPKLAVPFSDPRNQHLRLSFRFTDGTRLDYSDVRKFGTLRLVPMAALDLEPSLQALGPDAFAHRWTADELCARLRRRRTVLKAALLDQTVLAGIGNIYADEILWAARLHPRFPTERLTTSACARLTRSMLAVLRRAIRARGTSVDDFRDPWGRKGRYGAMRRVYQRAGRPCFRCGATIAKLLVGGRGTHVCPQCQRR